MKNELITGNIYYLENYTAPKVYLGRNFKCLLTEQVVSGKKKVSEDLNISILDWKEEIFMPERFAHLKEEIALNIQSRLKQLREVFNTLLKKTITVYKEIEYVYYDCDFHYFDSSFSVNCSLAYLTTKSLTPHYKKKLKSLIEDFKIDGGYTYGYKNSLFYHNQLSFRLDDAENDPSSVLDKLISKNGKVDTQNIDQAFEQMRLSMDIKNIELTNTITGKKEYLSIQELSEVLLNLGMKKEKFFQFCFSLIQGLSFKFDESIINIRTNFKLSPMSMLLIDEEFIQNY